MLPSLLAAQNGKVKLPHRDPSRLMASGLGALRIGIFERMT